MPRSKPVLIGICPYAYGTGLTRVMRTLMSGLSDTYEIHYLGIAYHGPTIVEGDLHIHPTNPNGGDVFAAFQTLTLIERLAPVAVFILHDLWMFSFYQRIFGPVRQKTKFVGYIPIDGNVSNELLLEPLAGLDRVAVYTDWAKAEFENGFSRLLRNSVYDSDAEPFPPIEVIPHGVDLTGFYPTPELQQADFHHLGRVSAKTKLFPDVQDHDSSFIVLNACCPSARKRVEITIEAFAIFAEGKPANTMLCLHQAFVEKETSELVHFAHERLGARLIYNPLSEGEGGAVSEAQLRSLYQATDLGVNTTAGEGWGLVSFEHAATGAAQILPNHSACGVLWDHSTACIVEPASRSVPSYSPLEMAFVEADAVAAEFQRLYEDRVLLQEKSRAAFDHVQADEFSWDFALGKLRQFIESALPN